MPIIENSASLQRARMYRVSTVFAAVFVHFMLCWTVWSIGYMPLEMTSLVMITATSAAGFFLLALFVWFDVNLSFEDPDLSVPLALWGLGTVILTAHLASDLKPVVLFAGTALVVVATNRLAQRQQLLVGTLGLTAYVVGAVYWAGLDNLGWITEVVILLAFGCVLILGPVFYQFERDTFEESITDKNQQLSIALERIQHLAVRDELTGVFNRRHLMDLLYREKARADRQNYRFSVCYADLDYFKRVNDKFGHAAGDHVLRSFAQCSLDVFREIDCVARMGGEEFLFVVAGASQEETQAAAIRLRNRLSELTVTESDLGFRITASMGIAEYRQDDSIQKLLDRADRALYEAKRTGRNRIVVADAEASVLSPSNGI